MPTGQKPHVVIIEDDDMLADFLVQRLTIENFDCTRYATGKSALVGMRAAPDASLILLDISLPDIDGFEVLTQIKKDARLAHTPVIITSNFSQEKDIAWGKQLGIERFLNKASLVPSEIVDIVTDVIAQKKAAA